MYLFTYVVKGIIEEMQPVLSQHVLLAERTCPTAAA
jgi:hypothetical protein